MSSRTQAGNTSTARALHVARQSRTPAVTIGGSFTDTFAGIAPASLPGFVAAQLVGLAIGVALLLALYPRVGGAADDVVVGHEPTARDDRSGANVR